MLMYRWMTNWRLLNATFRAPDILSTPPRHSYKCRYVSVDIARPQWTTEGREGHCTRNDTLAKCWPCWGLLVYLLLGWQIPVSRRVFLAWNNHRNQSKERTRGWISTFLSHPRTPPPPREHTIHAPPAHKAFSLLIDWLMRSYK